MVQLDYASDNRIIFHGYFGLFVYDLTDEKIIRSIDLESNNLNYNQGDNYCDVSVSKDGNIVQLHDISSEEMYVYNIEENLLIKCDYRAMDIEHEFELTPLEIREETYWYFTWAIKFNNGDVGYLISRENTIGTLEYIYNDNIYSIFHE